MSSLLSTNAFDYINVLDKAADAAWMRNDAISNNLSNVDTPGYKRQDVDFQSQLAKALGNSRYTSMDSKVANLKTSRLNPICYTDYASFSYRLDGNNVDVDTEGVYLAKNQITYQGLDLCISQEFKNLQMVMK
jgi:flagellar basal-body rod protein FlgB